MQQRTGLLLPLLLLLLLRPPPPAASAAAAATEIRQEEAPDLDDEDSDAGIETRSAEELTAPEDGSHKELLRKLKNVLHEELQRRSAAGEVVKKDADLSDIVGAAAKLGAAVSKEAKAHKKKKKKKKKEEKNFFVVLWLKLRKLLPLWAIIAVFVGAGLILLLLLVLIIYCCCCRNRSNRNRKQPTAQSVLYKDLDLTGANRPAYGIINYSLEYDLKKDNLIVTVSNCQDLPKGLDSLDPYVVVSVMSEKDEAAGRTRGVKPKTSKKVLNCSNPVFNFSSVFPVKRKSELKEKIVVFEVFDWDYGIKHDMVARKVVHLRRLGEGLDEMLGRNADYSKPLRRGLPRDERGPGDICLSLYYAAKDMSLTVGIIECKGVFVAKGRSELPDLETLPNTFVRLSLRHPQLKREQVKHSRLVSGARNPYFNQQFVFEVGARDMLDTCVLRVTLVHKTETLRLKRPVGSLELYSGADSDSLPGLHWRELLQTPNRAVARWHNLITPEAEERNRKAREKEEKRRLQELQEEADATAAAAAASAGHR